MNGLRRLTHAHFEDGTGDGGGGGGGGGGGEDDWRSALPEEMRTHAALQDFKDIGGLAKSFIDNQAFIGNSIRIPGEDASDEVRSEFNNKILEKVPALMPRPDFDNEEQAANFHKSLGVPDSEEGYEIPEVEIPDDVKFDRETLAPFKAIAKKYNLTPGQFKGVMEDFQAMSFANAQASNKSHAEAMEGLATEWGQAYDQNMKIAQDIAEKTGAPEGVIEGMKNGDIPPGMIKYFHSLAARFGKEGNDLNSHENHHDGKMTPDEAQYKLNEILNNKQHAYWDSKHPNHMGARKKVMELTAAANPQMSTDANDLRNRTTVINA
jgi:hypothetical protein